MLGIDTPFLLYLSSCNRQAKNGISLAYMKVDRDGNSCYLFLPSPAIAGKGRGRGNLDGFIGTSCSMLWMNRHGGAIESNFYFSTSIHLQIQPCNTLSWIWECMHGSSQRISSTSIQPPVETTFKWWLVDGEDREVQVGLAFSSLLSPDQPYQQNLLHVTLPSLAPDKIHRGASGRDSHVPKIEEVAGWYFTVFWIQPLPGFLGSQVTHAQSWILFPWAHE